MKQYFMKVSVCNTPLKCVETVNPRFDVGDLANSFMRVNAKLKLGERCLKRNLSGQPLILEIGLTCHVGQKKLGLLGGERVVVFGARFGEPWPSGGVIDILFPDQKSVLKEIFEDFVMADKAVLDDTEVTRGMVEVIYDQNSYVRPSCRAKPPSSHVKNDEYELFTAPPVKRFKMMNLK